MARFYGPIQQNPGGGEIIEIEPTALPTDAVILTNPVEGANTQEDANQYFYDELSNKADVGHTHGTDENGEPIDTSNLVTKAEFEGSQQTQDDRLTALESSGPGTGYDDTEVRALIQGNTDALDDKSDKTHTHDTTHDHFGQYAGKAEFDAHHHDGEYQPAGNYADANHTHDGLGGESYDDSWIQPALDAKSNKSHTHDAEYAGAVHGHDEFMVLQNQINNKADENHVHDAVEAFDPTYLEEKDAQQDARLDVLEAQAHEHDGCGNVLGHFMNSWNTMANGGADARDYNIKLHRPSNTLGGESGDLDDVDIWETTENLQAGDIVYFKVGDDIYEREFSSRGSYKYYYDLTFTEQVDFIPKDTEFFIMDSPGCEEEIPEHNHDAEYQPLGDYAAGNHTHPPQDLTHDHDAQYAPVHDHPYAPVHDHPYASDTHTHPPQDLTHDHDNDYAGKVHAHDEYASADEVTSLWVLANSNEAKANANTSKNTEQDQRLDALEADANQGSSTIFYQNTNSNIYQDGIPGNPSPTGWQGWHYSSQGDGTKINWYFYAQDFSNPEVFTGELNSFALLVVPESSNTRLPHVTVYTMPQGDGQDAQVWYRSRATYENTETNFTANQPYVLYYGEDPEIWENYPRKQLTKANYTSEGPQADGEGIFLLAIGSDSSAAFDEYNFTLQQSHIDSVDYVQNAVFLAPTTVEAFLPMGQTTYVNAEEIEVEIDSIKGRPGPKSDTVFLSDYDEELLFDDQLIHTQHDANEFFYRGMEGKVASSNISNMVAITQEDYDSLLDPDPNTLYVIVDQTVTPPEPSPEPDVENKPSDGVYLNVAQWSNGVAPSNSLNPASNQIKFNSDVLEEMNTVTFHKNKSVNPNFSIDDIVMGKWFIISQDTGRVYGEFTSIVDDARDTITVAFSNLEIKGTNFTLGATVGLGYFHELKDTAERNSVNW
jgi:hypothetical protein